MYLLLLFVVLFSFDVIMFITQHIAVSYQTSFYAEQISVKGKINHDINYMISTELKDSFSSFGIGSTNWSASLRIPGENDLYIYNHGTVQPTEYDLKYMQMGSLKITSTYSPRLLRLFSELPIWKSNITITKEATLVSEALPGMP